MNLGKFAYEDRDADSEETRHARRLALQSQQIERVFSKHQMPAHVAGGHVRPGVTDFRLRDQFAAGLERLRDFAREIKQVMGVGEVFLDRQEGNLRLTMSHGERAPLTLMDMLEIVTEVPAATALLGLSEEGRPVLLDVSSRDLPHVLISGDRGAGKSSLLRTIAVSLALTNRQSEVQLVVLSAAAHVSGSSYSLLEPLGYLPHMLSPVTYSSEEAHDVLTFLASEMEYRREQHIEAPALIVMIDGVAELLREGGQPLKELTSRLLLHGAEVGIHLIVSTEFPESKVWSEQLRAGLPVRIVGRMTSARAANIAAGVSGLQAGYLIGRGDFAAVLDGGEVTNFQAAFVGDYDLHYFLDELQRNRPNALLARPIGPYSRLIGGNAHVADKPNDAREFVFDGDSISWRQESDGVIDATTVETLSEEPPHAKEN